MSSPKLFQWLKKKNGIKEDGIIFMFFCLVVFFFSTMSPLHVWTNHNIDKDSSVFKTVAFMMEQGCMPYKDSFDHKGPLMYLINYWGNCISFYRGVWLIEMLFLSIEFYYIYKTARLFCKIRTALLATFTSVSLLFLYFFEGNLVEEYAMTFIAVGLFVFVDYFINEKVTKPRLFICGVSFAATLMLRPNMIALWLVMCIAVLIKCVNERTWKKLGEFLSFFIVGTLVVSVPIVIWLAKNGALKQCWMDYIVFNFKYTSKEDAYAFFHTKWECSFEFLKSTVLLFAFVAQIYVCKREKKLFEYEYLIYMIVTLAFMGLSGRNSGHYGMIIIPAVVYPISKLLSYLDGSADDKRVKEEMAQLLVCLYLLCVIILPDWVGLIQQVPGKYYERNDNHRGDVIQKIVDTIEELDIEKDETISVYGSFDIIYVLTRHPHATRYSYQFPVSYIMPEILDEYFMELEEEMPKVIVVQDSFYDENIKGFLEENQYSFIWGQFEEQENGGSMVFYRE